MTKVTLQTFPGHSYTSWYGTLHGTAGSSDLFSGLAALHSGWARHLSPSGGTGYITGNPYGTGKVTVSVNFPNGRTVADIEAKMVQVENEVKRAARGVTMTGIATHHEAPVASANAPMRALDGPDLSSVKDKTFPGNGENKIIASWLYGYAELTSPRLKGVFQSSLDADSLMYQDMTGGPGVAKPPYMRGGGNAVNPGWRVALGRLATEINWAGTDVNKLARRKKDAIKMVRALQSLNPEMGTYCNEADPDMPDVHKAFWGSNYPRLLSIKKKYDPTGLFWCKACVGSELWKEAEGGGLCKL
jgi:hypothetical protein